MKIEEHSTHMQNCPQYLTCMSQCVHTYVYLLKQWTCYTELTRVLSSCFVTHAQSSTTLHLWLTDSDGDDLKGKGLLCYAVFLFPSISSVQAKWLANTGKKYMHNKEFRGFFWLSMFLGMSLISLWVLFQVQSVASYSCQYPGLLSPRTHTHTSPGLVLNLA